MIGTTLSHYAIDAKLGEGGMGTVYRARDTVLGRTVAIKVLSGEATDDPDLAPRILREAKTASKLNHPNIVTVHELGKSGDTEFLVMEYVEGASLAAQIAPGGLPVDRATDYAWQVADALAAAHEAGLVHRDVKPGNVMVTPSGRIKVLDFGLARHLPAAPTADTRAATTEFVTRHGLAGTAGYMAPELIEGRPADARSDVFALGVLMFELVTGRRPFVGDTAWATMNATVNTDAPDVNRLRPDTPPGLARVVARALARRPEDRYASAREVANDLAALREPVRVPSRAGRRWSVVAAIVVLAVAAAGTIGWAWLRESRLRWVRSTAVPEISRLATAGDVDGAFRLAREALAVAPDEPLLQQAWTNVAVDKALTSEPPGADIAVKGFPSARDWIPLGTTPLANARIPFGMVRWRLTKPGYDPLEVSGSGADLSTFRLTPSGTAPRGMTLVPRGSVELDVGSADLPDYWIDIYEVTNRQFRQFIDAGGYSSQEYWREPFVKDGRTIGWDTAMAEFRDATGRPGPSTWNVGGYPDGQDDFPVSGVSWYEAAAYAVFAHRQLPTIYHWYRASGAFTVFSDLVTMSNFSGRGTTRVGESRGLGPFGTYDMAGNVKEWCWNTANTGRRYVLGGSFADATYQFRDPDAQSPFERRPGFGFRTIMQAEPIAAALTGPVLSVERDPATIKPVAGDIFQIYLRQYDYDQKPLETKAEGVEDLPAWRREKVSVAAAYGGERLPVNVYIPKAAAPPYQAVVMFPGSNATMTSSSASLWLQWSDFFVRSGRVLVYPVYQNTYERHIAGPKGPNLLRDIFVQDGKDIRRTLDYLASRGDIDTSRIAFYGVSLGAQLGPIFLTIEPRFKTGVLMSGGFETWKLPQEVDPINYTPHVTVPVLMVNGREDFDLPYTTAQVPMFRMLGTPAADKKHAVFEGGHIPANQQGPIKEMLDWLDKYLGPVRH
ncbi:MAG TPA: protein kinase [Vicinamibacterales bacterium]|nr:protein kinase [Vicinamibacterales bacterium]